VQSILEKNRAESLGTIEIRPEHFMEKITMKHFREALLKIQPGLSDEERKFYEKARSWNSR
ncbi:MAG: hypothetical protein GOV01_03845, partial [Candidatus Altiarchaeota archaeon]|nr:hypothetical protein [Candidatus Altiarchaeota archaeon]